jgi:DNA repair exonuclease SbcCD ATPase subunit
MHARKSSLLIVLLSLTFAGLVHAAPKMYKWVDKNGVTQYGSSIPPEYASQASEQINSQGQVISTQSAQKTPEQLAAEAAAQQQAQQQAQAQADAAARDKVLLDTYTSVGDIERDRDSKLSAMDAQINVLNGSITSAQNTLAEFQSRANELTSKNKPVPPDLQKHMDAAQQQFIANQQQLLKQQQNRQQMSDQYASEIARFKELTAAPAAATH